jgi:hypothetical protein
MIISNGAKFSKKGLSTFSVSSANENLHDAQFINILDF